ncbi:hypothetical protein ACFDA3_09390 [Staphylococcus epidermidis]|uniref:hypothetical protein n=1 Tax=Staphylococcus epidermidis TaxID=1282 RepID=UPI0036D219CD
MRNSIVWKITKIIVIIGLVLGVIFVFINSFQTLGGFNFNSFSSLSIDKRITIILSFWGLFATFGGAYLGASISSKNAFRIEKERQKNDHFSYSLSLILRYKSFVEEFDEELKDLEYKYSITFYEMLNTSANDIDDTNTLNNYKVKNILDYFDRCGTNKKNRINKFLKDENMYHLIKSNETLYLGIQLHLECVKNLIEICNSKSDYQQNFPNFDEENYYEKLKDNIDIQMKLMRNQHSNIIKNIQYIVNEMFENKKAKIINSMF